MPRLVRIGFDHIVGVLLASTIETASKSTLKSIGTVTFAEVPAILSTGIGHRVLNIRLHTEFSVAHLRNAQNIAHARCSNCSHVWSPSRVCASSDIELPLSITDPMVSKTYFPTKAKSEYPFESEAGF